MGDTISKLGTGRLYGMDEYVNTLLGAFLAVAVVGWGASIFLTAVHFWALPLPAGIEPEGSMAVITSSWAYVGPVPLALHRIKEKAHDFSREMNPTSHYAIHVR